MARAELRVKREDWAREKKLEADVQSHPGAIAIWGINRAGSDSSLRSDQWGYEGDGYDYGCCDENSVWWGSFCGRGLGDDCARDGAGADAVDGG